MSDRDKATGRFLPGNKAWEARSSAGPKPIFDSAEKLWDACVEYFEWVEENPLLEGIAYQGKVSADGLPKMRAMTTRGLCLFLDIGTSTWDEWKKNRADLSAVIARVEDVIYSQKFAGAAAGMLNPNIIARDLGLAEKKEHTGADGGPLVPQASNTDVARWIAFTLAQGAEEIDDDISDPKPD